LLSEDKPPSAAYHETVMPNTLPSIHRVAVIGAGTMGAQIAAHLANCGIPSFLLDVPAPA
jgi:glutamyl-tRNA reductase